MKKIKNLIILATVICFVLAPISVFAWFFVNDRTPMSFRILEIRSKVTLYEGNDINNNGVPDIAADKVQMAYYTEKYDFKYLSEDNAATEEKTVDIKLNITIKEIVPGQTKTFKLALENTGDTDNTIDLSFNMNELTQNEKDYIELFSVRARKVVADSANDAYSLESGEKIWFMDMEDDGYLGAIFSDKLPGMATAEANNNLNDIYMDFWVQFYMEPFESVNEHRKAAGKNQLTEDEYNAFANKAAENIKFYVSFDVTD